MEYKNKGCEAAGEDVGLEDLGAVEVERVTREATAAGIKTWAECSREEKAARLIEDAESSEKAAEGFETQALEALNDASGQRRQIKRILRGETDKPFG